MAHQRGKEGCERGGGAGKRVAGPWPWLEWVGLRVGGMRERCGEHDRGKPVAGRRRRWGGAERQEEEARPHQAGGGGGGAEPD